MSRPKPLSIEDEIAHLRRLDLGALRARRQSVFQRPAPAHLTQHLLFSVIAYRIQADRFGELDDATRQVLHRSDTKRDWTDDVRPASELRPEARQA